MTKGEAELLEMVRIMQTDSMEMLFLRMALPDWSKDMEKQRHDAVHMACALIVMINQYDQKRVESERMARA